MWLGFRVVTCWSQRACPGAAEVEPVIEQVFVKPLNENMTNEGMERQTFCAA